MILSEKAQKQWEKISNHLMKIENENRKNEEKLREDSITSSDISFLTPNCNQNVGMFFTSTPIPTSRDESTQSSLDNSDSNISKICNYSNSAINSIPKRPEARLAMHDDKKHNLNASWQKLPPLEIIGTQKPLHARPDRYKPLPPIKTLTNNTKGFTR